jgi:hypothetical protein
VRASIRYIVAPRYRVRTERGVLEPESPVTEDDFAGYSSESINSNTGKTEYTPITPRVAFHRALELGVVLNTGR